jgi:hypothetical protein
VAKPKKPLKLDAAYETWPPIDRGLKVFQRKSTSSAPEFKPGVFLRLPGCQDGPRLTMFAVR